MFSVVILMSVAASKSSFIIEQFQYSATKHALPTFASCINLFYLGYTKGNTLETW